MRMTRLLVILLIALQPALMVEGQACMLSLSTGTASTSAPVFHGEGCCGKANCCLPDRCGCKTQPTDNNDHPHPPLAPAPSPTRIADVLATPSVLPATVVIDEPALRPSADSLAQPPPYAGVGSRLSFLCLWLT